MKNLRNLTIKDEWLRYCRLLSELGMQGAACNLFRLITHYAYYNEDCDSLINGATWEVKVLYNTIKHEIDADEKRFYQLSALAPEEIEEKAGEEEMKRLSYARK